MLLPIILLAPYSLTHCFAYILIITEDYFSLLIDMIYLSYIFIYDLKTITHSSLISFITINAGFTTIMISLKVFISVTMIVGNIIHIYLFSVIVILISLLLHLIL